MHTSFARSDFIHGLMGIDGTTRGFVFIRLSFMQPVDRNRRGYKYRK